MNAMTYLFFTKLKGTFRNIFSKPLSAILTILGVGFYAFFMIMMLMNRDTVSKTVQISSMETVLMMFIGFLVFLFGIMLFQKRTSVVTSTDAYFIFAGPFSRKQILSYLLAETVKGSVIYALFSIFYLLMIGSSIISAGFILFMVLHIIVIFYVVFALITYLYFLDICGRAGKIVKIGIAVAAILMVSLLIFKNMMKNGFDIQSALIGSIQDPYFYAFPIIGWMKWALISFLKGNLIGALVGTALNLAACALLTWLTITVKGDFYERAIADAEWMSELRKSAKQGKAQTMNQKITSVEKTNFGTGAKAIASKGFLQMKKNHSWITKRDILLIALYMIIAKAVMNNFLFYQYYILLLLIITIQTDSINEELKKHYIYLIPEPPLKKMFYLLQPSIIRLFIWVLIAVIPAGFVFQASLWKILSAVLMMLGYAVLFIAGSLWSLKILKSRTNASAEQFLKMLFIFAAMVPSIIITIGVFLIFPNQMEIALITASSSTFLCNILVGLLLLLSAKSIFNGTDMMKD